MTVSAVGDVTLFHEETGSGPSLVLVHGSWGDHHNWDPVVPLLAGTFRVVTYDRRGHSQSPQAPGPGSINQDVQDLAGLIELLDLAPAFVAGNSFGSLITLRLVTAHADVLRGVAVHEPPGIGLLADDPAYSPLLEEFRSRLAAVIARLERGEDVEAADLFVETIAFGPGAWAKLPAEMQATFVRNAQTYLDEIRDPDALEVNLEQLRAYTGPALLTQGDQSPPMFAPVLDRIAAVMSQSVRRTYAGAGHVPHATHPEDYVRTVTDFAAGTT